MIRNCLVLLILTIFQHEVVSEKHNQKYILYDTNPGEGFNLRRDVYMRIAVLVKSLNNDPRNDAPKDEYILVLPPWGRIGYHWGQNENRIAWKNFFNLQALNLDLKVIEFEEYLETHNYIDHIWYLQNYKEGWNGKWEEKMDIRECNDDPAYFSATNPNFKPNSPEDKPPIKYKGWFYGYTNSVHGKNFICLSVQGHASILKDMIFKFMREFNSDSILIDRAETVLHDKFGQYDFWQTRRSMQFSRKLYDYAVEFQKQNGLLGQNKDKATVPYLGEKWIQKIRKPSSPIGHDFIAAHIRRRDFIRMQEYRNIPSIKSAMDFLIQSAIDRSIYNIFIATDGNEAEITEMHHVIEDHNLDQPEIRKLKLVMFRPSHDEINQNQLYKGSIAIIDQIICSHASYFVGTEESTFSFRIHDEREILGFDENTTFNHFCSDGKTECGKPTHWEIIYNIKDEMY